LQEVQEGYPAKDAGLMAGDRIVSVNGRITSNWYDLTSTLKDAINQNFQEVTLTYERQGERYTVDLPFGENNKIGIMVEPVYEKVGFFRSVYLAGFQCYYWTALSLKTIAEKIYHKQAPDMAGPIGIFELVGKGVHRGAQDYFFLIALISVAIGMFNLFPIPILDGGHIVFFIIEGITKKRPTEKVFNNACGVGAIILISLVLFATYQDVGRLKNKGVNKTKIANSQMQTEQAPEAEVQEAQND
jgi:regulator of sigma E protease